MIDYLHPLTWLGPVPSSRKTSRLVVGAGLIQLLPAIAIFVFYSAQPRGNPIDVVEAAVAAWSLLGGAALVLASVKIRRVASPGAVLLSIVLIATMMAMIGVGVIRLVPAIATYGLQGSPLEVLVSTGVVYVGFAGYTVVQLWRVQNWAAKQRDNPPMHRTGPAV